jgi:hypothetical protein
MSMFSVREMRGRREIAEVSESERMMRQDRREFVQESNKRLRHTPPPQPQRELSDEQFRAILKALGIEPGRGHG